MARAGKFEEILNEADNVLDQNTDTDSLGHTESEINPLPTPSFNAKL